ncbi:hypothetical protein [Halomonas urmiana]|uniref:hypothetical protein n=1 Tax=Halomonas urmiana TaxID=490901 RepID=UPI001F025206|nr:hypothetical protein [Halomonas urmiana]
MILARHQEVPCTDWFISFTHLGKGDAARAITAAPLLLAWITERLAARHAQARRLIHGLGVLPVPLLALVVLVIAASQVNAVIELRDVLLRVLGVFVAYLLFAACLGKLLGQLFRLDVYRARTLAFSFGTRNSFVMLPLALTLPEALQAAVVVIVFQSLVELFGMVAYLSWVPSKLLPEPPGA